jgi:hypothetical protein
MMAKGTVNSRPFLPSVQQSLDATLEPGEVIIIDNAPAHNDDGIR